MLGGWKRGGARAGQRSSTMNLTTGLKIKGQCHPGSCEAATAFTHLRECPTEVPSPLGRRCRRSRRMRGRWDDCRDSSMSYADGRRGPSSDPLRGPPSPEWRRNLCRTLSKMCECRSAKRLSGTSSTNRAQEIPALRFAPAGMTMMGSGRAGWSVPYARSGITTYCTPASVGSSTRVGSSTVPPPEWSAKRNSAVSPPIWSVTSSR